MPNINPPTFTCRDTMVDVLTVGTEELNRKLYFAQSNYGKGYAA